MTQDPIVAAASIAARKAAETVRQGGSIPATVLVYSEEDGVALPVALVQIDGDPPEQVSTVVNHLPCAVSPGDRVMVTYQPPHGAAITGSIGKAITGGGRPPATLVVAAADATAVDAASADYVCDGVDDHLTIQEALDSLANAGGYDTQGGGLVLLTEGTFIVDPGTISAAYWVDNDGHRWTTALRGMGWGTVLVATSANTTGTVIYNTGGYVADLAIRWTDSDDGLVGVDTDSGGITERVLVIEETGGA